MLGGKIIYTPEISQLSQSQSNFTKANWNLNKANPEKRIIISKKANPNFQKANPNLKKQLSYLKNFPNIIYLIPSQDILKHHLVLRSSQTLSYLISRYSQTFSYHREIPKKIELIFAVLKRISSLTLKEKLRWNTRREITSIVRR